MANAEKKKRRRRLGDRKDGRKVRTLIPMAYVSPYIMKNRIGSMNLFADKFDMASIDKYIRKKRQEGLKHFGVLHVLVSAYVRTVAAYPGINRFCNRQKIYARDEIQVVMAVKKEMSLDSPDTMIKAHLSPDATADEVYKEFDRLIDECKNSELGSDFDKTAKIISKIPGLALKFAVWFLNLLDYFGWLPKKLLEVSPFHGSMIITSMGSLGIPPIYHHLYDFGNLPLFIAYGAKRTETILNREGEPETHKYIDFTICTDERICDGYYYAAAFKNLKYILKKPEVLDLPPEKVVEDIE